MDLSQLLAMIPGLMSSPYGIPIGIGLAILGPKILAKFPGLANIFKTPATPSNPLSPLIQPTPANPLAPSPGGPLSQFPLLNSLLNSLFKGKPPAVGELPPAFLISLRDELGNVIDAKRTQYAAELMQLQGFAPEDGSPVK